MLLCANGIGKECVISPKGHRAGGRVSRGRACCERSAQRLSSGIALEADRVETDQDAGDVMAILGFHPCVEGVNE